MPHQARGLCNACYSRALRAGVEHNGTPPPRAGGLSRDDLLHEVAFFLDYGDVPPEAMHERLGVSREALLTAVRRGADAGDVRAVEFRRRSALPDRAAS